MLTEGTKTQCGNGAAAVAKGHHKSQKTMGGGGGISPQDQTHDVLPDFFMKYLATGTPFWQNEETVSKLSKLTGLSRDDTILAIKAVTDYTGTAFTHIRSMEKQGKDEIRVKAINQYLEKMPKFKGEVFRGQGFRSDTERDAFVQSMTSGSNYKLPAMSSFSSSQKVAEDFAGTRPYSVVLQVKSNKKGASVRNISEKPEEDEVLVPKNTQYKATGKPYTKTVGGKQVVFIPVEEV